MANENNHEHGKGVDRSKPMDIICALITLRDDLKKWVANNLKVKLDKNLGADNANKILSIDAEGNITSIEEIPADKVITTQEITLAGEFDKIGNYDKGHKIEKGSNLQTILTNMLQTTLQPKVTSPSITLRATDITMQEVGTEYTLPTITLTPTFGEYTYGPATGVEFEAYKEENKTQIAGIKVFDSQNKYTSWTNTESINTDSEEKNIYISSTEKAYMIDNPMSATSSIASLSCVAYYTAATSPAVDNLGNPSDPLQTIAAGKIEKPLYIQPQGGFRYMFGGGTTNSTTNSETIRALEKKLACNNNNTLPTSEARAFEFIAKKGDTKVIFAFPHDTRYNGTAHIYNKTPKFQLFTMAWGDTTGFEKLKKQIEVADARGNDGYLNYDVYEFTPPSGAFEAEETKYRVYFE